MFKVKKDQLPKRLPQLALVSFIAACSENSSEGLFSFADGFSSRFGGDDDSGGLSPANLAAKAPKLPSASNLSEAQNSGFTAGPSGDNNEFKAIISTAVNSNLVGLTVLTFSNGAADSANKAKIYQLRPTTTTTQYDLVVSSHTFNQVADTDSEYQKGRVFIYWNMSGIQSETSPHLEIQGRTKNDRIGTIAPEFLKLGGEVDNYDMVIRAQNVDKSVSSSGTDNEGAIYILWDVAGYAGTTRSITLNNTDLADKATAGSLAIYGAIAADYIGNYAPEFLQLGGKDNNYDMVIESDAVDRVASSIDVGAIYILWDVADYFGATTNITLDDSRTGSNTALGSLAIYGAKFEDYAEDFSPEFLKLGGNDGYDMVIRSPAVDKDGDGDVNKTNEGAIFILWDVANYAGATTNIILDGSRAGLNTALGSLAIYGVKLNDYIGLQAPEFLHIGGKDNNYDMVIRSEHVDSLSDYDNVNNQGAIYILWDIADYAGKLVNITLGDLVTPAVNVDAGLLAIHGEEIDGRIGDNPPEFLQLGGTAGDNKLDMVVVGPAIYILWDVADYTGNKTIYLDDLTDDAIGATAGSLAIQGARQGDSIGSHESKFLKVGGKDGYDMVIRSEHVDKSAVAAGANTGAIYVLWDVADYYSTGADKNKSIDLTPADATSGLLTIYGREGGANLGSDDNNILYGDDGKGNTTLGNFDQDTVDGGTNDIAFRDDKYTYILFGDKIATTTGTGDDEKVTSKTIDLSTLDGILGVDAAGFFEYDFTANNGLGTAAASTSTTDRVGYRFVGRKTDLGDIALPSPLSDADADLGVWDIA